MSFAIKNLAQDRAVLIAGPTASGKSALALEIADTQGGQIINADALQVFSNWSVLTARPSKADLKTADHYLYGHIGAHADYSVGHWLNDLRDILKKVDRPIIVGGTGLYFTALTKGLADIPAIPSDVRTLANHRMADEGSDVLLAELDTKTAARIDTLNPVRVQRAWEVLQATKTGLADWQDRTPPPLMPLDQVQPIVFQTDKDWLNSRIVKRFDTMLEQGAIEEARHNLMDWNPNSLSSKAIGAPELIAYLKGGMTLGQAREAAIISSRQYAKRQRTWFRARMKTWQSYACPF
ncbi:tRNA (adenosine(37)-N6)-dimethylallyltransferase MiaA [Parasulfitobacter algicola]|uniref:tRNA dimethylallyltransferase n=1 Tax=Parasulfitobacter algicola TaxID=2614809 RepID=A0ABX2IR55_9RHOB|nr:tRNA (adenosine(37)-N6)-dimethylallyltransferase MiaA [Sulfitobacter algicola]NSX55369.1 tRNA (adenosine(37)-N6)-dimethylallyltransferase MiaA [Sulfitobacter algicola]